MEGYRKEDSPTKKQLPVEIDVPEFLAEMGMEKYVTEMVNSVGGCAIITLYYLLRVGEYMIKKQRNETKKRCSSGWKIPYFFQDTKGHFHQLPRNALDKNILSADGVTLKLDNKKKGWKGVCVYQEHNGDERFSPVRALGRRFVSIREKVKNKKTYLSAYWMGGKRKDLNDDNMSAALKFATTTLNYPYLKGIPIHRVDTHSLRSGGANALSLAGYSKRYIQKIGRWRG